MAWVDQVKVTLTDTTTTPHGPLPLKPPREDEVRVDRGLGLALEAPRPPTTPPHHSPPLHSSSHRPTLTDVLTEGRVTVRARVKVRVRRHPVTHLEPSRWIPHLLSMARVAHGDGVGMLKGLGWSNYGLG